MVKFSSDFNAANKSLNMAMLLPSSEIQDFNDNNSGTLVEIIRTTISIGFNGKFSFGPFYSFIILLLATKTASFSFPSIILSASNTLLFPFMLNFTAISLLNYSRGGK